MTDSTTPTQYVRVIVLREDAIARPGGGIMLAVNASGGIEKTHYMLPINDRRKREWDHNTLEWIKQDAPVDIVVATKEQMLLLETTILASDWLWDIEYDEDDQAEALAIGPIPIDVFIDLGLNELPKYGCDGCNPKSLTKDDCDQKSAQFVYRAVISIQTLSGGELEEQVLEVLKEGDNESEVAEAAYKAVSIHKHTQQLVHEEQVSHTGVDYVVLAEMRERNNGVVSSKRVAVLDNFTDENSALYFMHRLRYMALSNHLWGGQSKEKIDEFIDFTEGVDAPDNGGVLQTKQDWTIQLEHLKDMMESLSQFQRFLEGMRDTCEAIR
jgi:hypothetical protein